MSVQDFTQALEEAAGRVKVPDPYTMSREEFINPPKQPRARSGWRTLYHKAKNNDALKSIVKSGILPGHSPPKGSVWATVGATDYSAEGPLVAFQVPKDDPLVDYVAGNQALIMRPIPASDILWVDPYFVTDMGAMRLSEFRGEYADINYDEHFGLR